MERAKPNGQQWGTLAAVLLLALALRLLAAWWWHAQIPDQTRFGFGDSESYWELGRAVAQGEPYAYGDDRAQVFRTPGYPLLLAGWFAIAGEDVLWARFYNALWATLAVGGVYWFGRQLFDHQTGLLAALLASVYPGGIAMGAFILSEAPFCALALLQFILWRRAWREQAYPRLCAWMIAAGAIAGGAALVKPSWLLFTPFAIAVGLATQSDRKRHLASGVALLLGLTLVMAPWWIRNARLTGMFVPTTLTFGASLYDGLNPNATGASNMDFVADYKAQLMASEPTLAPEDWRFEHRLDAALRNDSLRWAAEHPWQAVRLMGVKLVRLWNVWPNEPQFRSPLLRLVVLASYGPLLLLGFWGVWKYARRDWPYVWCVLPAVYFSLIHVIFVSSIRYREPAMLPLIVLAAGALVEKLRPKPPAA